MARQKRFPFTKSALEALPTPATGRVTYHDAKTTGLSLRVGPSGNKSFCWYRKVDGRPVRVGLGKFPGVSVEQARRAAERLSGEVVDGRDPQAERRQRREEPTLSDLFRYWMESHAKPRKRTWEADQRQYDTYLAPWAGRRLSALAPADVRGLQSRIAEQRGRYIANKVLTLLRAMYNRAADIGFTGANPTAGIKKYPEEKRDRFLHGDELKAFFQALAAELNTTIRDYFMVSLLTGARKGNVLTMRWADIDFGTGLWRIPETKSGVPIVVPLTAAVLRILETRQRAMNAARARPAFEVEAKGKMRAGGGDKKSKAARNRGAPNDAPRSPRKAGERGRASSLWVFPGHGKTGHLVEPKSAWKRIIQRAGLVDVRPHDLRRSLGSWMAMTGAGLPIVGKMLGHTQPGTTAIYARLSVDPVRESAEKATAAMLEAGGVGEEAEQGGPNDGCD